jgi:hypothetical protein
VHVVCVLRQHPVVLWKRLVNIITMIVRFDVFENFLVTLPRKLTGPDRRIQQN